MKKIYLLKVNQNGHERYLGCADARILVNMARKAELKAVQDAQRPIDPKRLEDLSKFIMNGGTLSTSLVIGTIDDRIKVYPIDEVDNKGVIYYTEFPETESEFEKMVDAFDIMDGQHRLFSFLSDYCKIPEDEVYELSFEMYLRPTRQERMLIFKNTNEEQKAVPQNLLLWFRNQLGMLRSDEKEYYNVICMLNDDQTSPLYGRIIMSAESIPRGIKSNQLIALFNKVKLKESINTADLEDDDEKLLKIITIYLRGWEDAVGSKLSDGERSLGAFSKIAGLRYMINLLPTYFDLAIADKQTFDEGFVKKKVTEFFATCLSIEPRDFFDKSSIYYQDGNIYPFGGESITNGISDAHKHELRNIKTEVFDPMG